MRIDFRQGIITYPTTGQIQTFLLYSGGYVSLSCSNGRVDVAFAHLTEHYLLSESTDVPNAWGPLAPGVDYWLYWDIDLRTAVRTFGVTTWQPVASSLRPVITEGQHWFDTSSTTMYVATSGAYRPVARVFAAKIKDGVLTPLGSGVSTKPYAGTQVGLTAQGARTGRILVDNAGAPVRRNDGRFFTTEADFFVDGSPVNATSLEGAVVAATAVAVLPKFHVVKFTEFGKINLATYHDLQTSTIALLTEDLTIHQVGSIILQGYVSNPDWNWTSLTNLWVGMTGNLVDFDPHKSDPLTYPTAQPPVARVVSSTSIIFDQRIGGAGGQTRVEAIVGVATNIILGSVRLNIPALDGTDPVVVGGNDPRLSNSRAPLAHTHVATAVIPTPYGSLTGANLQLMLQQLEDNKVDKAGDTMTGLLVLSANPTVALGAATKQYVDANAGGDPNFRTFVTNNTASGSNSLFSNIDGSENTASGYNSLFSNISGFENTASGYTSLFSNTTGSYNDASGSNSLFSNTTGSYNTASGAYSLQQNTTGSYNDASGSNSLFSNTTGSYNTASGVQSLSNNTMGSSNTTSGFWSLFSNTTGSYNTASGEYSLYANTTGTNNTASGIDSLSFNTTGFNNTASGVYSLQSNTTGSYNTAIGSSSLFSNTTGSGNIGVGGVTDAGVIAPVFDVTVENNRVVMGSTAVTNAYIKVAWTVVSDARDKTNFAAVPHGLDFVTKLNPVAYQFRTSRDNDEATGPVRYGFKAQDVLDIEGDSPVVCDVDDAEKLRLNETSLIPILVNAIKELTSTVKELKAEFDLYKNTHP